MVIDDRKTLYLHISALEWKKFENFVYGANLFFIAIIMSILCFQFMKFDKNFHRFWWSKFWNNLYFADR